MSTVWLAVGLSHDILPLAQRCLQLRGASLRIGECMPRYVAVVFVHGIFNQELEFAAPMEAALRARLPSGKNRYVQFVPVEWARAVRIRQRELMNQVRGEYPDILYNRFRRFLIEGLGDAAAYHKSNPPEHSSYRHIQNHITETLYQLDQHPVKNRPLIFIAHSLGCHIVSSYAWDINKLKQRPRDDIQDERIREFWDQLQKSPFRRLDTFAGFVTLGSNMPLFTFPFSPDEVRPITSVPGDGLRAAFPGRELEDAVREKARWLNFFSKRDILGFPLRPLYYAYDVSLLDDIDVQSESLTSRFVPYLSFFSAHVRYWTNKTVIQRTAELISNLVGE
jgi:hypothetical protein